MSQPVVTVQPDTEVHAIARLLVEHRISGVVVVDAEQRPLGVVSASDLLYRIAHFNLPPHIELLGSIIYLERPGKSEERLQKAMGLNAEQIMSKHPQTVPATLPIEDVADRLVNQKVHRVPVVDNGKVVGIVTRGDIVRHTLAKQLPA